MLPRRSRRLPRPRVPPGADGGRGGHTAAFEKAEAYDELHVGPLEDERESRTRSERLGPLLPIVIAVAGLLILVLGGRLLVDGAVAIARIHGAPEAVIGLTIVAIGTSAPEFFASLVAALRGHSDVALGNVMGSNIYNVLGIGGAIALLSPTAVPTQIVHFDNLVMVAAALALLLFARMGYRITRTEGAILLAGYAAYLWALWPGA
jgi:cation:H+ antiporter